MSTKLSTTTAGRETACTDLVDLANTARSYATAARAAATVKQYEIDWRCFADWCIEQKLIVMPAAPATVALYLTAHAAELRTSTLAHRMVAIGQAHRQAGQPDPTTDPIVRAVMSGVRRTHGTAPVQKAALLVPDLKLVIQAIPDTLTGYRDRALLLLGFATALRRSELVALDVEDLEFIVQGLLITIKRSKTDQEGVGRKIAVPYVQTPGMCAVKAVQQWMQVADVKTGPLFRGVNRHDGVRTTRLTDKVVALVLKARAEAVGLDPDKFAGHSLRSGFATSAAAAGVGEREIAKQTGHASMTVLRRYIHSGTIWQGHPLEKLGL